MWASDGGAFVNRTPSVLPGTWPLALAGAVAVHDSQRRVTRLIGAPLGASSFGTWEWDGGSLLPVVSPTNPQGQFGAAAAYDPTRNVTLLFGGGTSAGLNYGDTWELGAT